MTNENECGCRLPCGICMITNRKCPIPTINDLTYSTDDIGVGGVHLDLKDVKLMEERIRAKMKEEDDR